MRSSNYSKGAHRHCTLSMGDQNVCMNKVSPMSTGMGLVYAKPKSWKSPGVFCTKEKDRKRTKMYVCEPEVKGASATLHSYAPTKQGAYVTTSRTYLRYDEPLHRVPQLPVANLMAQDGQQLVELYLRYEGVEQNDALVLQDTTQQHNT